MACWIDSVCCASILRIPDLTFRSQCSQTCIATVLAGCFCCRPGSFLKPPPETKRLCYVLVPLSLLARGDNHGLILDPENGGTMADEQFTNKLIDETSPYLLQHAHNPVKWYP